MSEIATPHSTGSLHATRRPRPASTPSADASDVTQAAGTSGDALAAVVFNQIQIAAQPVATAKGLVNMLPINEGTLGDFPWFWQSGTNFNARTYEWLNKLFAYDPTNGYVATNGEALTTAYFNVLADTAYVLDAADASALNTAVNANQTVANTVISDFGTVGPVTGTTLVQQLNYITEQVLTWGTPGLTLSLLRNSTNPTALLTNIPPGAGQVVNDLMTYLANTSSVANIQAAVLSMNNQLNQTRASVAPQTAPTAAGPGFMTIISDDASTQVVPQITLAETVGNIQNNLLPATGGTSFSASFQATSSDQNTMQLSVNGSSGVSGDAGFFLSFGGGASTSYNVFQFASDLSSCQVTLTFNGVTTITPSLAAYNISTGTGWWNPGPIEAAANPVPNQSGYQFSPAPPYDFTVQGNFGTIARLLISQQPVISLTYQTQHFDEMQKIFEETVSWSTSFCGIDLGGGSESYYSAQLTQNSTTQSVTVTMSPVGNVSPVTASDQLAYVVGAQILWPGSSHIQNAAGI